MRFIKWLLRVTLSNVEEGLILAYQYYPDDRFKDLIIRFVVIESDLKEHLKTLKKDEKSKSHRNASDLDSVRQSPVGSGNKNELAKETEVIQQNR